MLAIMTFMDKLFFGESPTTIDKLITYSLFFLTVIGLLLISGLGLSTVIFSLIAADIVAGIFANHTKSTATYWRNSKYKKLFIPAHLLIYVPLLFLTAPHIGLAILFEVLLFGKLGMFYWHALHHKSIS